jgi:hypothetical protein
MTPKTGQRRIRQIALALASPPVLLFLFLLIVNPGYLGSFFPPSKIRYALPIAGLIVFLTATAYPAMLGSLIVFQSGRRGLGILLMVVALALLVFPAVLLLLLTPATFAIMDSIPASAPP